MGEADLTCEAKTPSVEEGGRVARERRTRVPALREDALVQKANESIAIRPRKGRLTLLSRRIYNALLYHAQCQGHEGPYTLPLATLLVDAHFNSRNVALLKEHIREMQTTLIEWNSVGAGEQRWTSTQLLGSVEIAERGSGYPVIISWSYPDKVRDRLLKPARYTKLLLEMGAQMRSYAAAVLFELGMQYLTSPSKLTMREDLYWWASVLTGRSDIDKVDYRYFKRDVLRPALSEVDALQDDFSLSLIEHRDGRRVAELQFMVQRKSQMGLSATAHPDGYDLVMVERLRKLGLKDEEADRIYQRTDENLLRSTVEHVEQRASSTSLPPLAAPAAYLRDALKKGYAETPAGQGGSQAIMARSQAQKPPVIKASVQTVRDEWDRAKVKAAEEYFGSLTADQGAPLREEFEEAELPSMMEPIARAWRRDGAASKVAGPIFFRWLARRSGDSSPTEKDLLEFAIAKGMLSVHSV